jgi:hypothetical protein
MEQDSSCQNAVKKKEEKGQCPKKWSHLNFTRVHTINIK